MRPIGDEAVSKKGVDLHAMIFTYLLLTICMHTRTHTACLHWHGSMLQHGAWGLDWTDSPIHCANMEYDIACSI